MNNLSKCNFKYGAIAILAVFSLATLAVPSFAHAYGYGYDPVPIPVFNYNPATPPVVQPYINTSVQTYQVPMPVTVQVPVQVPVYYPVAVPVPVYPPLSVSCSANVTYTSIGTTVRWSAYASGGNGYYNYSWSGSDGTYGQPGQSVYVTYNTPGQKFASVTVNSNGQVVTQTCRNTVSVYAPVIQPVPVPVPVAVPVPVQVPVTAPVYVQPQNNNLDIGCFADPTSGSINQPVTWNAEVTGGVAPYAYSWTGSDNLSGSQSSIIKWYSASGEKFAIVTVTSADGRTGTRACSNSITIKKPAVAAAKTAVKQPVKPQCDCDNPTQTTYQYQQPTQTSQPVVQLQPQGQAQNGSQVANSYFSLSNVPWGWVAVLVILILFATVLYLLFNRQKI